MENTPTFVEHVASAPHMVMKSPYLPKSHRKHSPPRQPLVVFQNPRSHAELKLSAKIVSLFVGSSLISERDSQKRCALMSRISIPSRCNKAQVTFEVVEVRESMSFKISV